MSRVTWKDGPNSAMEDLAHLSPDIAGRLLWIGEHELRAPEDQDEADPDEGAVETRNTTLLWRRGISREERRRLREVERRPDGAEDEDDGDQSWDYVLIYRERTFAEIARAASRGFVVLRVVPNSGLALFWLEAQGSDDQ